MTPRRVRQIRQGQALAEFAIVFPVLILILAAILQFGLIFSSQIGLTNSVREAARYGSVLGVLDTSSASAARTAVLTHLVGTGGTCGSTGLLARNVHPFTCAGDDNSPGLGPTSYDATYCRYQNAVNNDWSVRISVFVAYNHPLLLPIVGNIIDALDGGTPGSYRLGASEQMRVENRPDLKSQDVSSLTLCP